ncbi:hypothetical protein VPHD51_0062 [Vibrio phage D51]
MSPKNNALRATYKILVYLSLTSKVVMLSQ